MRTPVEELIDVIENAHIWTHEAFLSEEGRNVIHAIEKCRELDIPFGFPIPNRPGFVHSPYSRTGAVDVQGFKAGDRVKCPLTGSKNIFIVPET